MGSLPSSPRLHHLPSELGFGGRRRRRAGACDGGRAWATRRRVGLRRRAARGRRASCAWGRGGELCAGNGQRARAPGELRARSDARARARPLGAGALRTRAARTVQAQARTIFGVAHRLR